MSKKKKKKRTLWFEDSFDDFRTRRKEMGDMMREMWSPFFRMPEIRFPRHPKFIRVRIGEAEEEILLRAELPGFTKEEIKLKVTPYQVFISAENKKKSVEKDKDFFRSERFFKTANRTLRLPVEVDVNNTKAKLKDGVLEIILPKKEVKKKEEKEVKIE